MHSFARMLLSKTPWIVCDSADFDGTNDYMERGAALTGIASSKSGILSCWYRIDGGDATTRFSLSNTLGATGALTLSLDASNNIRVLGFNSSSTGILNLTSSTAYAASGTWRHILASWDLAVAGSGRLYISDADDKNEVTYTNDTIAYASATDWAIGAVNGGTSKTDGCLAEVYFAPGQYLDFALVSNRRKFISASGKPVHLGSDGSLPTGTAAIIYQHLDDGEAVANFATNAGTGGNFTITGTLTTGSSSPSD